MVRWPQCDPHSVCFDGNLSQGPAIVFGFTAPLSSEAVKRIDELLLKLVYIINMIVDIYES